MVVIKYTEAIQKLIKSKVKSKPWLHLVFDGAQYAIYVWDTREVLESGICYEPISGTSVHDNREPLKGSKVLQFKPKRKNSR